MKYIFWTLVVLGNLAVTLLLWCVVRIGATRKVKGLVK